MIGEMNAKGVGLRNRDTKNALAIELRSAFLWVGLIAP